MANPRKPRRTPASDVVYFDSFDQEEAKEWARAYRRAWSEVTNDVSEDETGALVYGLDGEWFLIEAEASLGVVI
jgi:hypothetical protein